MVTRVLQILYHRTLNKENMRTTCAGIPTAVMNGETNPEDGHEYIEFPPEAGIGSFATQTPVNGRSGKTE